MLLTWVDLTQGLQALTQITAEPRAHQRMAVTRLLIAKRGQRERRYSKLPFMCVALNGKCLPCAHSGLSLPKKNYTGVPTLQLNLQHLQALQLTAGEWSGTVTITCQW